MSIISNFPSEIEIPVSSGDTVYINPCTVDTDRASLILRPSDNNYLVISTTSGLVVLYGTLERALCNTGTPTNPNWMDTMQISYSPSDFQLDISLPYGNSFINALDCQCYAWHQE